MITRLDAVASTELWREYLELEPRLTWYDLGTKGRQAGVQTTKDLDPAVGHYRMANEVAFDCLAAQFQGTLIADLVAKYSLTRTRLLWLNPWSCYSMHRDLTARIHIPLKTNSGCWFVFRDSKPQQITEGHAWRVDTRQYHTFMNGSDQSRLHLVGSTV